MSDTKDKNTEPKLRVPIGMNWVNAMLTYEDNSDPENPVVRNFDLKSYLDERFDELKKLLGA